MKFIAAAALFAAMTVSADAASLDIEIFDNGTLIDSVSSVSGAATLTSSDAVFSNITVAAQGSPILPRADLSSVTLDATASATFTGTHDLVVDVFQTGVSGTGNTLSTFTINGLVNDPGPTTESSFADGLLLSTHTFPAGLLDGSVGPLSAATGPFTSDELQYVVAFTAPSQSFGGSSQLTTNVPEAPTWAMLLTGLALLGWAASRKPKGLTSQNLLGGNHGAKSVV